MLKVFNLILKSEVYPELWRENYIKPVLRGDVSIILQIIED
jgi:hypothetical protein